MVSGCLAVLSWSFFTRVYQLPERPEHYRLLRQFDQLKSAPSMSYEDCEGLGESLNYESFQNKFHALKNGEIEQLNRVFLRNFLRQYKHAEQVYFLEGRFVIREIKSVNQESLYETGVEVELQSLFFSGLLREKKAYPFFVTLNMPDASIAEKLKVGDEWTLSKRKNGVAIMWVGRSAESDSGGSSWKVEAVPLLNEKFYLPERGSVSFESSNQFNLFGRK